MWHFPRMDKPAQRLRWARERAGYGTAADAVKAFGWTASTYYGHENGDRIFKTEAAKRYAQAFNVPWLWLLGEVDEAPQPVQQQAAVPRQDGTQFPPNVGSELRPAPLGDQRLLPVYGQAVGGEDGRFEFNGEIVDRVLTPPMLVNVPDAYAVFVSGESMEPRYFAGETVYVHPRLPLRKHCFVVAQVRSGDQVQPSGYVKQFIAWTPTRLILKQFNPPIELEFDRADVLAVHRVVLGGDG